MSILSLLALLVLGGVIQAVVPPFSALGRAPLPVLPGLVVYYALTRTTGFLLAAAVLAGIVHDSLGLVPLGYSSLCFGVGALWIHRFRSDVFTWDALTRMVMGFALAGGSTLALSFLLRVTNQIAIPPGEMLWKAAGSGLLGGFLTPWICAAAEGLDGWLDIVERERE